MSAAAAAAEEAAAAVATDPGPRTGPRAHASPSIHLNPTPGFEVPMARSTKMSVLKRQRERKKAEKAAQKRELKALRKDAKIEAETGQQVATRDDLESYGVVEGEEEAEQV